MKLQLNRFKLLGSDKLVRNLEPHSGTPMPMPTPNPTAMEPWSHGAMKPLKAVLKRICLASYELPWEWAWHLLYSSVAQRYAIIFHFFSSSFCCTFTFPIVAALGNLQFAILIYEFAQGVKVAQAMGRVLYGAALAHQCDDRPQIGPTIWTASTQ